MLRPYRCYNDRYIVIGEYRYQRGMRFFGQVCMVGGRHITILEELEEDAEFILRVVVEI